MTVFCYDIVVKFESFGFFIGSRCHNSRNIYIFPQEGGAWEGISLFFRFNGRLYHLFFFKYPGTVNDGYS